MSSIASLLMRRCEGSVRATERMRDIRLSVPLQYELAGGTFIAENICTSAGKGYVVDIKTGLLHTCSETYKPEHQHCQHTTNGSQRIPRRVCYRATVVRNSHDRRKEGSPHFLRTYSDLRHPGKKRNTAQEEPTGHGDRTYQRLGSKTSSIDRYSCVPNFGCEDGGNAKNACYHPGMRI